MSNSRGDSSSMSNTKIRHTININPPGPDGALPARTMNRTWHPSPAKERGNQASRGPGGTLEVQAVRAVFNSRESRGVQHDCNTDPSASASRSPSPSKEGAEAKLEPDSRAPRNSDA